MIISVTLALYWQLIWFRCRCWRKGTGETGYSQLKLGSFAQECSYPTADETPYSTQWIQKNKATPWSSSLTVVGSVISYQETRMLSTYQERNRPACYRKLATPPCRGSSGQSESSAQGSHRSRALGVKLVGVTKQPVLIKLFRRVLPSCKRTRKCGRWCIIALLQLCDKPSCHGSCKCVYT